MNTFYYDDKEFEVRTHTERGEFNEYGGAWGRTPSTTSIDCIIDEKGNDVDDDYPDSWEIHLEAKRSLGWYVPEPRKES